MTPALRVSLLGPVRAWAGDVEADLGSARQRALFAVLAAGSGRPIGRDELIEAVWGASPPASAGGNVYTYVSRLRRDLGADRLVSGPHGYRLSLDRAAVDVVVFERLRAEAGTLLAAGDPVAAAERLDRALGLWHGDAYAGLSAPFLDLDRHRLTELRLATAGQRARLLLDRDDDTVIADLTALVRDHPLHELLYELLIQALHRAGRLVDALDVFAQARDVLKRELGVEPGSGLRAMRRKVLAGTGTSRTLPELVAEARETVASMSAETQEGLRRAALLLPRFTVDDLAAVTGWSSWELVAFVEEALAAHILVEGGDTLAFRLPLLRSALRDSSTAQGALPLGWAARSLAAAGAPVDRVAEQLAADPALPIDGWVRAWLLEHHGELARRRPRTAAALIRRVPDLDTDPELLIALVKLDFRLGNEPVAQATAALRVAEDPDRSELRRLLATMLFRRGQPDEAMRLVRGEPEHGALRATIRRGDLSDPDAAERRAEALFQDASLAGRHDDVCAALQTFWFTSTIRRDHERALTHVDRALELARGAPEAAGRYFDLMDNRVTTLHHLDRLAEARRTLDEAARFARRHRLPAGLAVASVVHDYWTGRWHEALAAASTVTDGSALSLFGSREPGPMSLLLHGVAAVIALRQESPDLAAVHLNAAEAASATDEERDACEFLVVAKALSAADGLGQLAPLLRGGPPMTMRHPWLPDVVRMALAAGRRDVALRAAEAGAAEAAREVRPARAYAANLVCQALLTGRPEPAVEAAARYRAAGRVPELAAAQEDAAVLLAAAGRPAEAMAAGRQAIDRYDSLAATRDTARAHRRFKAAGLDLHGRGSGTAW